MISTKSGGNKPRIKSGGNKPRIKSGGNKPRIKWDHVDGPVMHLSDCRMHWLTWPERIALWLGLTTVERINRKRTMEVTK